MNIFEKMLGKKPKTPQEIEESLTSQIAKLETKIEAEKSALGNQQEKVRSISLERMGRELEGLRNKRGLVWEKTRREGEKVGELMK